MAVDERVHCATANVQAAFGYEYKSVEQALPAPPDHLLRVLPRAFTECMYRIGNPMRAMLPCLFKWGKVPSLVTWGEKGEKSGLMVLRGESDEGDAALPFQVGEAAGPGHAGRERWGECLCLMGWGSASTFTGCDSVKRGCVRRHRSPSPCMQN